MGVKGLKTLMESTITDGLKDVNIGDEIIKFQSSMKIPLLVIDLETLAFKWSSVENTIVGMRGNEIVREATTFFDRLKNFGATMVFFDGGIVHKTKKERNFYDDRIENSEKKEKIVSDLQSGMTTKDLIHKHRSNLRGSSTNVLLIKEVARPYGKIYAPVTAEKHTLMAALATRKGAFAVLGSDTNLLVYCAEWRFWSLEDIDFEKMVIKEYDTNKMLQHLNLNAMQMPLFATLACNNFIPFEDFEGFHERTAERRLSCVADFVRGFKRFPLDFQAVEGIVKIVFRKKLTLHLEEYQNKITERPAPYEWMRDVYHINYITSREYEKKISESLASYELENVIAKETEDDDLLKKIKKDWTDIYEILKNLPAIIVSSYVDVNGQEFKKTLENLALPLLQRLMGVLWDHMEQPYREREVFVSNSFKIKAKYPKVKVPPLEKLIFREDPPDGSDSESPDGLDPERRKLLKFIVKPRLDVDKLFQLKNSSNEKLIPTVAMLHYFVKKAGMKYDEANVVLLSVYETMNEEKPNKHLKLPKNMDLRAFKIVFLFITIERMFPQIFATLGYKELAKHVPFDGLHFHLLWNKWQTMDEKEKESRLNVININLKELCLPDNSTTEQPINN